MLSTVPAYMCDGGDGDDHGASTARRKMPSIVLVVVAIYLYAIRALRFTRVLES